MNHHRMKIIIIQGPNLNLLGVRQPEIYGNTSFEVFLNKLQRKYQDAELEYFQSNHEGALIDKLHECGYDDSYAGIILNAGAYAHTSLALADAIAAIVTPVVELHISNIHAREEYRHYSYMAPHCKGVITGFGLQGYELAIMSFVSDMRNGNSAKS